jgi:hypothetical protein
MARLAESNEDESGGYDERCAPTFSQKGHFSFF